MNETSIGVCWEMVIKWSSGLTVTIPVKMEVLES